MIDEEKLLLDLDDIRSDIENRIVDIEYNPSPFINNSLKMARAIAELKTIKKAINLVATSARCENEC